ncbi:hypothetical protein [Pseudomonas luteola]|uniref:hypothetical protein n=1 Tax=Pseudomonas luteola TaxID=47886 RepID=UPI00289FB119|nr:hypothetical protein [Pseudomonas luteola]
MNGADLPVWNDLLPSYEQINTMQPEKLDKAEKMAASQVATLALGISGIGNLLACTASNDETGLSESAVTDVGWMLESLGKLICSLSDTQMGIQNRLDELAKQPEKTSKPRT